jgi:hypothetical protein
MKSPIEFVPLLVAGAIGAGVLVLLINFFDNTNAKTSTYLLLGFVTGIGVQMGVRVAGVS